MDTVKTIMALLGTERSVKKLTRYSFSWKQKKKRLGRCSRKQNSAVQRVNKQKAETCLGIGSSLLKRKNIKEKNIFSFLS